MVKPKECWNCKGVNFRWFHHSEFFNMLIHQCKKCLKEYFIPANEPMYCETTTYMYNHFDGEIRDINGKVKKLRDIILRTEKQYQLIMSKRSARRN
jgi:hypothetical protein